MGKSKNMGLEYTGERVVPNKMHSDVINWMLHLQRYVFVLKYAVNQKVLDVACGTGYGMSLLSSVAKSVEGIDIDSKTIKWAKENNHFYCPVKFRLLDLEKDKIPGGFDCIVSFETIEHLDKPETLITNVRQALNSRGLFIFSTPVNEPPNPLHKRNYTWSSIKDLIANNFSRNIEWHSQTKEGVFKGKRRNALFAIGVAYKGLPSLPKRIKKKTRRVGHLLKLKLKQQLGLVPKSRW